MRAAIALSLAIAAPAIAAPAIAQVPVDESLDEEGRALFVAGRAAFGAERFEDALEHFSAAYDRSRRAELLYNVALAADRLGRVELALEAYEKYIDSLPDSPFAPQAIERVAALRMVQRSEPEPEPQPEPEPTIEPARVPVIDTHPPTPAVEPVVDEPDADPEPRASLRGPGFVLLAGGGAALVAGLALIVNGVATRSDVEDTTSILWTDDLQDDYDAATRRTATGIALGAVGLAAAAAGLLMVIVGPRDDSVALNVGPGSLSLRGRF